jgi:hypothetical protein
MPKTEKPDTEADAKDTFTSIIEAIDSMEVEPERHLSVQIDRALREGILATKNSGQGASITISLKVKRDAERRVTFVGNVALKAPRPPSSAVTLYTDDDGHVHRSDPAQLRMDFPRAIPLTPNTKKEA